MYSFGGGVGFFLFVRTNYFEVLFIEDAVGAILLFLSEIKQLHLMNNRREESHSSNVTVSQDGLLFIVTFLAKKTEQRFGCIFGNIVRLHRDGILSPAIDSKESIPPAYVARAEISKESMGLGTEEE